jgi:hypothetical protein
MLGYDYTTTLGQRMGMIVKLDEQIDRLNSNPDSQNNTKLQLHPTSLLPTYRVQRSTRPLQRHRMTRPNAVI